MPYFILIISLSLSTLSLASTIAIGSHLSQVEITSKGQVTIIDESLIYQPWESNTELGERLVYIQHLAGRVGVKELNKNLSDAIVAQQISPKLLASVIIINSDDSVFGTAWLVASEIKKNKETYPSSTFIDDSKGVVADVWGLPLKSVTSLIVAANGEVLFRKDGATSDKDIAAVMALLRSHLPELTVQTNTIANAGK
ncbi:MAG: YtfJ family uncharacterized protein [Oleiphilaceae bacterium]|jgi:YtfJ family uncharacterized protein